MGYRLRSVENPAWEIQIGTSTLLVGRSRDCQIKLSDPSGSRHHAQISLAQGVPVVTDLNSGLGTFVNHGRVRSSSLKAGDLVAFGRQQFQVEATGPELATVRGGKVARHSPPGAVLQLSPRGVALSIQERKEILEKEIATYLRQGWRVASRTDVSAQMTRDKSASCLLAFILALFFILPAILYLLLYRGSDNRYLEVDEQGKITAT